ncbi:MAG: recombinase zinc beta ribbon domain-containing protein [Candidatus Melainabacteria bacterium]|nr:recombinase zinc beta ribbon domain-containing protein [Candidatus Melainabacteria bacterium]
MVTPEEFDKVQYLLGRDGKPLLRKHDLPFKGVLNCAECGALFTVDRRFKVLRSTGQVKEYIHYHCTGKKGNIKCTNRLHITQDDLQRQVEGEIGKIRIEPIFWEWALEVLNDSSQTDVEKNENIVETKNKTLVNLESERQRLIQMGYKGLILDDDFIKHKEDLEKQISSLKSNLSKIETKAIDSKKTTEKIINFAAFAKLKFANSDIHTKKSIVRALGSERTINRKKLAIRPKRYFIPLHEQYPLLESEFKRFGTDETLSTKEKGEALIPLRLRWRGRRDSNSRPHA